MRYRIMADTSEREKSVGGIMTFGQAGWLVLGVIICGVIFVPLASIVPPIVALIIGIIPGAAVGVPFAFYNKGGLTLAQYLVWRVRFSAKSKMMVNTMSEWSDHHSNQEEIV